MKQIFGRWESDFKLNVVIFCPKLASSSFKQNVLEFQVIAEYI